MKKNFISKHPILAALILMLVFRLIKELSLIILDGMTRLDAIEDVAYWALAFSAVNFVSNER